MGYALHAVTAEAGGDEAMRDRLEREGLRLRFPVHSDPELKLASRLLVHNPVHEARNYAGGQRVEYQPGLLVLDRAGLQLVGHFVQS